MVGEGGKSVIRKNPLMQRVAERTTYTSQEPSVQYHSCNPDLFYSVDNCTNYKAIDKRIQLLNNMAYHTYSTESESRWEPDQSTVYAISKVLYRKFQTWKTDINYTRVHKKWRFTCFSQAAAAQISIVQ
jgi:hypothetical protein